MDSIRSIVEAHFAEKDGEDVPFDFESHFQFFQVDLTDKTALTDVFAKIGQVHACIHFAGLKAVGESTSEPLLYYRNNVFGSINLLEVLSEYSVPNLGFPFSFLFSCFILFPLPKSSLHLPRCMGLPLSPSRKRMTPEKVFPTTDSTFRSLTLTARRSS